VTKYAGRPFALLGINTDADPAQARQALAGKPVPWPSLWDGPSGPLARRLGVEAFPSLYLLDGDGVVRRSWTGVPDARELESAIDGLLAKRPPT